MNSSGMKTSCNFSLRITRASKNQLIHSANLIQFELVFFTDHSTAKNEIPIKSISKRPHQKG